MIKMVKLKNVAYIESRPIMGKIYPKGTIIIQISATKGQVLYLRDKREIENKYAVISARECDSFYLFSVIEKFFPAFFERYRQGLNFKAEELSYFMFPMHQDYDKQKQIGRAMRIMAGAECFY